jgi:hypothetical protein
LLAIYFYLGNVPLHSLPKFYLPLIIYTSASHILSTVPLKPSSRVFHIAFALAERSNEAMNKLAVAVDSKTKAVVEMVNLLRTSGGT